MRIATALFLCLLSVVRVEGAPNDPLGSNPWIYFADNNARTINRLRMDGSGFQVLANTDQALVGLTIDTTSRHLYWSDNPQNGFACLHRAELDGSNVSITYQAAASQPERNDWAVGADERSQRMYWIDSAAGRIRAINLDGSGLINIIENDRSLDTALELDLREQVIYFTTGSLNANTAKIERVQIDGSCRQLIANTYAYSIFLDKQQNRILGADWDDGWIFELVADNFNETISFPLMLLETSSDIQTS